MSFKKCISKIKEQLCKFGRGFMKALYEFLETGL